MKRCLWMLSLSGSSINHNVITKVPSSLRSPLDKCWWGAVDPGCPTIGGMGVGPGVDVGPGMCPTCGATLNSFFPFPKLPPMLKCLGSLVGSYVQTSCSVIGLQCYERVNPSKQPEERPQLSGPATVRSNSEVLPYMVSLPECSGPAL